MTRLGEVFYKAAFIGRWYFWYNLELALLHSITPKGVPFWPDRGLAEESRAIDRRRQELQRAIYALIRGYGSVCAACGACCKERVDRFTAFDAAARAAGPMPLKRYGREILSPLWIVTNGLKHTGQRAAGILLRQPASATDVCENLGASGCTLAHDERPMLCASWFCPKYLRHMDARDLRALAPRLREMERLHFATARLLRKSRAARGKTGRPV